MQTRLFIYSLALGMLPGKALAKLVELELLNKSDLTIEYKDGIRSNPPTTLVLKELAAGKTAKFNVDTDQFPQLLIREKGKSAIAYIFEFTPTEKTSKMRVRFVADKKGPRLEPQTQLLRKIDGNITDDQIKMVGQVGEGYTPQSPVAKPETVDEARLLAKKLAEEAQREQIARHLANPSAYAQGAPAA